MLISRRRTGRLVATSPSSRLESPVFVAAIAAATVSTFGSVETGTGCSERTGSSNRRPCSDAETATIDCVSRGRRSPLAPDRHGDYDRDTRTAIYERNARIQLPKPGVEQRPFQTLAPVSTTDSSHGPGRGRVAFPESASSSVGLSAWCPMLGGREANPNASPARLRGRHRTVVSDGAVGRPVLAESQGAQLIFLAFDRSLAFLHSQASFRVPTPSKRAGPGPVRQAGKVATSTVPPIPLVPTGAGERRPSTRFGLPCVRS
ncbi:hypothetical protein SAMN05216285_4111 [Natrinema salifodinae]|uniref:Uncharacterized protein n=1 Tax=Natrinema salifodinae TaxID=1202768 RepID=A0A1I0QXE2_9EURY|nr:hypothetical protein SAMN05216285_4111 [Natrinema salifodinae]